MKSFFSICILGFASLGATSAIFAAQADAPTAAECASAATQKMMNACAYEDFLAANGSYADTNKTIMGKLTGKPRELFRRSQKAWIAYTTAACEFESSALAGGSAQGMVRWQCAARLTRQRVADLATSGNCKEGDLTCVRFKQ